MSPTTRLRPPAVPLLAVDPYFSVWSRGDALTDVATTHWTGAAHPLAVLVRIDGTPFRLVGTEPGDVAALPQTTVDVHPTRTVCRFEGAGVGIELTFTTPAFVDDLLALSLPITYLDVDVGAIDGGDHEVALYVESPAEFCVGADTDAVVARRPEVDGVVALGFGAAEQRRLHAGGDAVRIEWGWSYLAVADDGGFAQASIATDGTSRQAFVAGTPPGSADAVGAPWVVAERRPVAAVTATFAVAAERPAHRHVVFAYDDEVSIEYFHRPLRPYWRAHGLELDDLLRRAIDDHDQLVARSVAYDERLEAVLVAAGGADYAALAALVYRQALAAHKLVVDEDDGTLLHVSKENTSNGCLYTVDVTYPSSPFFLVSNPELMRAQLIGILEYASSPSWPFPFAPHDLGTYPRANGQVYGGGAETLVDQMPVEECGNMLILVAALGERTGDWSDAKRFAETLRQWAGYLAEHGADPVEQLCTDDFAGPLDRNANLSIKAITALRCYARICTALGNEDEAVEFDELAGRLAEWWMETAADGAHTVLAFGRPDTWSIKYNLLWDRVLDLGLFPTGLIDSELEHYRGKLDRYGLPLDSRERHTKLDWQLWTASLTDDDELFDAFLEPILRWAGETDTRHPVSDWYRTDDGSLGDPRGTGFYARSVVAGVFVRLLVTEAAAEAFDSSLPK